MSNLDPLLCLCSPLCFVFRATNGTLYDALIKTRLFDSRSPSDTFAVLKMESPIASALSFLHSHSVVYAGVSLRTVRWSDHSIYLSDFSSAIELSNPKDTTKWTVPPSTTASRQVLWAPEMLDAKNPTVCVKSDM